MRTLLVVEAEFMRNAFAIFGVGGRLQLSLFAIVDDVPIGGEGCWKHHVMAECKLSWTCLEDHMECCVDGLHNWHEKFLLGRYNVEVLSNKAT
jgi:hypothetical protein